MGTIEEKKEMNARLLVTCFGWWWGSVEQVPGRRLTALFAGENDLLGYRIAEWTDCTPEPSDEHAPRFLNWDQCNVKNDDKGRFLSMDIPNVCEDPAAVRLAMASRLSDGNAQQYIRTLEELLGSNWIRQNVPETQREDYIAWWAFGLLIAPPRIQAEALLRTLGVWPADNSTTPPQVQATPNRSDGEAYAAKISGIWHLYRGRVTNCLRAVEWKPGIETIVDDPHMKGRRCRTCFPMNRRQ